MNAIVREKIPQIVELCKKYRVVRMYLFGSAARNDFDPMLDVLDRGENFFSLMWALDELMGRKVDLMTESQLKNPYLIASIDEDKKLIYEAAA